MSQVLGESGYTRVRNLGEGTFGVVYLATRKEDGREVAIKRTLPLEKHRGLHFSIIREVKFLQDLHSNCIVELIEVFLTGDSMHMVLEYCPFDLKDLIYDKKNFLQVHHIKSCLRMILEGVSYCHGNFVLHRDLKPANILIAPNGQLRLADFGAAKSHSSPRSMTTEVVTRAYRAPELLFGATLYAGGVDVWAVGCIFS
jgi:cyclin-dependent kinase 7